MKVIDDIKVSTSSNTSNNKNILYIGAFLGSVILMSMAAGNKATYYYLLLVIAGVAVVNVNKYNIRITTPEIMKE